MGSKRLPVSGATLLSDSVRQPYETRPDVLYVRLPAHSNLPDPSHLEERICSGALWPERGGINGQRDPPAPPRPTLSQIPSEAPLTLNIQVWVDRSDDHCISRVILWTQKHLNVCLFPRVDCCTPCRNMVPLKKRSSSFQTMTSCPEKNSFFFKICYDFILPLGAFHFVFFCFFIACALFCKA